MQLAIMRRNSAKVLVKQGSVVCHHANEANETSILTRSTWALFWISITESDEDWRHNRQTKQNTFFKRNIHTSSVESSLMVPASSCSCLSRSSSLACACLTSKEGKVSISAWAIFCWVSASNWASCFCLMIEENDFEMKQNCKRTKSQSF